MQEPTNPASRQINESFLLRSQETSLPKAAWGFQGFPCQFWRLLFCPTMQQLTPFFWPNWDFLTRINKVLTVRDNMAWLISVLMHQLKAFTWSKLFYFSMQLQLFIFIPACYLLGMLWKVLLSSVILVSIFYSESYDVSFIFAGCQWRTETEMWCQTKRSEGFLWSSNLWNTLATQFCLQDVAML